MLTLFLDTNIWNLLVENSGYNSDQLRRASDSLIGGAREGEWQIVCSLPVLQEILATYRENPTKFKAINSLLFRAVQNHWLIELNERYVRELHTGGLLETTGRYIDREKRRKIETLASKKKEITDINELTHQEGVAFKAQQEDARAKVYTALGSVDGKLLKNSGKAYQRWFESDRDLQGWVYKVLEGGVDRGLYKASVLEGFVPTKDNCPSVWRYVDFRQAKVKLNLGEQRKILPSDAVDADIYGCSPYYDILVTQDKNFRDAVELIRDGSFELQTFEQLMQLLEVA